MAIPTNKLATASVSTSVSGRGSQCPKNDSKIVAKSPGESSSQGSLQTHDNVSFNSISGKSTQTAGLSVDSSTHLPRRVSLGSTITETGLIPLKSEIDVDVYNSYDQNQSKIEQIINKVETNMNDTIPNTGEVPIADRDTDSNTDCEMIASDQPFPLPMMATNEGFIKIENDTLSGSMPFITTVSLISLL